MSDVTFMIIRYLPEAAVWVLGIIWAVRMRRENYDAAGKLFLSGCVLMLVRVVFRATALLVFSLSSFPDDMGPSALGFRISLSNIPGAAVAIVGIICLFMAFRKRFFFEREA